MKLTADTITDDLILALRQSIGNSSHGIRLTSDMWELTAIALGMPWPKPHPATGIKQISRAQARAACAEYINRINANKDTDQ